MHTTVTVTDRDIRNLRTEAAQAGDLVQVALCDWALGHAGAASDALVGDPVWGAEGVTRADARAECERVIAEARAALGVS